VQALEAKLSAAAAHLDAARDDSLALTGKPPSSKRDKKTLVMLD